MFRGTDPTGPFPVTRARYPMRFLVPAALALASTACFATRNDVRILQGDIFAMRTQQAKADSARAKQLSDILAALNSTIGVVRDSVTDVSLRLTGFQGATRQSFYSIERQLAQLGELMGQSQTALQRFRADIEERNRALMEQAIQAAAAQQAGGATGTTTPPTTSSGTPPATGGDSTTLPTMPVPTEGPNTLYQIGRDQIMKGAYGAARDAFTQLLVNFGTSDLAPAAQAGIADALGAEQRTAESDSAYRVVFTRWPSSDAAPTAMYRLGLSLERQGRIADARTMMQQLVRNYPLSQEYSLASDWLDKHP